MRFDEFAQQSKPKTPNQARIDSLKQQKDRAAKALKTERERQKITRAQAKLADISRLGNGAG